MRALLGTSASSQPGAMSHRRPLPDRDWRRCSGSSLLGISRIPFGGRGSSTGISAGINAGLPHCQRARIHTSSNRVHRRRAPPYLIWRRAMASRPANPRQGELDAACHTCARLATASRSAIVVAGACALTDGRPISATARLDNELIRRKASALSSRSRRVERQPLPCRVIPPLDLVKSRMRRRSVGRPSHGRRGFNDGRTVDPPVFPQGNPGTSAGQLSPDRAVVRGQPVDQPGSCQVVCT